MGKEDCAVTWEAAENVPHAVIQEYERGTETVATEYISQTGIGQELHTITVTPNKSSLVVPTSRPVIKQSIGYAKHFGVYVFCLRQILFLIM